MKIHVLYSLDFDRKEMIINDLSGIVSTINHIQCQYFEGRGGGFFLYFKGEIIKLQSDIENFEEIKECIVRTSKQYSTT